MLIDFLIGFGVVNTLPHYLFARMKIGVLSLFGFSPLGNYCYSAFCLVMSLGLFAYKYGFRVIGDHMMLVGVLWVVFAYLVLWDFMYRYLRKDPEHKDP